MNGFVPVSKANLKSMAEAALVVLDKRHEEAIAIWENIYINAENERCEKRRIFGKKKPRFDVTDMQALRKFAWGQAVGTWDYDPFKKTEDKYEDKKYWLNNFLVIAESVNSDEPIQIDANEFLMLNNPEKYYWINVYANRGWKYTWSECYE